MPLVCFCIVLPVVSSTVFCVTCLKYLIDNWCSLLAQWLKNVFGRGSGPDSDQKCYKWILFLGLCIGITIHLLNKSYINETLLKCIIELLPS